ncbi:hypothetical protein DFJ77DRAFT_467205 [Powellomyces hirtus]|nr:hypothetical protein DFJ77DRAFT_467205 [Powellomyces hirtus]
MPSGQSVCIMGESAGRVLGSHRRVGACSFSTLADPESDDHSPKKFRILPETSNRGGDLVRLLGGDGDIKDWYVLYIDGQYDKEEEDPCLNRLWSELLTSGSGRGSRRRTHLPLVQSPTSERYRLFLSPCLNLIGVSIYKVVQIPSASLFIPMLLQTTLPGLVEFATGMFIDSSESLLLISEVFGLSWIACRVFFFEPLTFLGPAEP